MVLGFANLGRPVVGDVLALLIASIQGVVPALVHDREPGVLVLQALRPVHELLVIGRLPPVEAVPVRSVLPPGCVKAVGELVTKGRGDKSSVDQRWRETEREAKVEDSVDEAGLDDHVVHRRGVEGIVLVLLPVDVDLLLLVERVDLGSPMIVAYGKDVPDVILTRDPTFQIFIRLRPGSGLTDGYLDPLQFPLRSSFSACGHPVRLFNQLVEGIFQPLENLLRGILLL